MAVSVSSNPVYTVKFINRNGGVELIDFPATGTADAESQWKVKYPNCQLVNIFRAR